MFRFFKYIVLFLLGYKVLKTLFAEEPRPQRNVAPPQQPQDNHQHINNSGITSSKYNDAELIDYEEVK